MRVSQFILTKMIIRKLENIENSVLHDAVLINILSGKYSFIKIYVDPNKECAITFTNHMNEEDIKLFFFNINPNVTSTSSPNHEKIELEVDYSYDEDSTTIYTRPNWKY